METIDFGLLSIIPPIIAIILALITKEVIASLLIGILSGTLIYNNGNILKSIETLFSLMSEKIFGTAKIVEGVAEISSSNAYILIFLGLLGALVVVITMAGGSKAYGDWAITKIKSPRGAKLSTFALGSLIFIDDYFNCLTVGTVMRPVCDKHQISRAKLAYIIDSTAAPICIIAPISSWATAVGSIITDSGVENGMNVFMQTIPLNFYAILTIIMVIYICWTKFDFGPMKKFQSTDKFPNQISEINSDSEMEEMNISSKGKLSDLCIPIGTLIVTTILLMMYSGGFFEGNVSFSQSISDSNVNQSLVISAFISLIVSFFLFIPRKLLSYKEFMAGIGQGVKSMVPAFLILILAWTMSGVCRDLLNTGAYVGNLVEQSNIPMNIFPAIIFIVAAALAFAMGTSWGTFAILIPIVIEISSISENNMLVALIAATLGGAVFGDHCSPISDTTILASTGAKCNHLTHVSTQIIYALVVGGCSLIGYLIIGFTNNIIIAFLTAVLSLVASISTVHIIQRKEKI